MLSLLQFWIGLDTDIDIGMVAFESMDADRS